MVVAAAVVTGCGDDARPESLLDEPVPESADDGTPTTTDRDRTELERGRYSPGDCIDWEEGRSWRVDTKVVDCSSPHQMQFTERIDGPDRTDYPSDDEWDAYIDEMCAPAAERFLGTGLDPFGRFVPRAIYPRRDAWTHGDRSVSCGIFVWPNDASDGRSTEDARTADQAVAYDVGDCVPGSATELDLANLVVGCDQPHKWEVTGRVGFDDLTARPSNDQIAARCAPISESYFGGPAVPPWDFGYAELAQQSWDAGTRTTHCFIGQWDDDGNLLEITGSATG